RPPLLPATARVIVIVEGPTDEQFIRIAAARCKRPDLVRDLHISPAGGAQKAAVQAVLMRAQNRPVLALFDDDPPGKAAYDMLRRRYSFDKTKQLLSYREVVGDNDIGAEAEDLLPPTLLDTFVKEKGEEQVIKSK